MCVNIFYVLIFYIKTFGFNGLQSNQVYVWSLNKKLSYFISHNAKNKILEKILFIAISEECNK